SHDDKIGCFESGRLTAILDLGGLQIRRRNFPSSINTPAEFSDLLLIDIEANHRDESTECDRDGKADVSEAHDSDASSYVVPHREPPSHAFGEAWQNLTLQSIVRLASETRKQKPEPFRQECGS